MKGYVVSDGYMGYVNGKYMLFETEKSIPWISSYGGRSMSEKQVREIKRNLCINCCDKHFCHGMQSCKDANEYLKKGSDLNGKFNSLI